MSRCKFSSPASANRGFLFDEMKTYTEKYLSPIGGAPNRGKRVSRKRAKELFAKMKRTLARRLNLT